MPTLKDLRVSAGLTYQEALNRLQEVAPTVAPKGRAGIIHWEKRGTERLSVIRAIACAYGIDEGVVISAATATRESARQSGELVPA